MKIIDLTHPITENMPMYPGTAAPSLQIAYNCEQYGFMETLITMYSHTGTHIDAPAHLYVNGLTLEKYPIEQFVGKALVIDCRKLEKGENIPLHLLDELFTLCALPLNTIHADGAPARVIAILI